MKKTNKAITIILYALCYMIISISPVHAGKSSLTSSSTLVYDEPHGLKTPRHFRLMSSPFQTSREQVPTRAGLKDLKLSASAQFSEDTLQAVLPKMQGDVWVVDLRRESHGFIDGHPISWYAIQNQSNLGFTLDEIEKSEILQLKDLKAAEKPVVHKVIEKTAGTILDVDPKSVKIERVESEQQLCQRLGLKYKRIPVSDHQRSTDQQIDEFVQFYQNLPENAWLHMHCRGGKGRTTTFLMLVDMMKNAKTVSLEDLAVRHELLGGSQLLMLSDEPEKQWKHDWAKWRKSFIELFYHYAKSDDFPRLSWTQWLEQQTTWVEFDAPL